VRFFSKNPVSIDTLVIVLQSGGSVGRLNEGIRELFKTSVWCLKLLYINYNFSSALRHDFRPCDHHYSANDFSYREIP
jgi:hypothetical protein